MSSASHPKLEDSEAAPFLPLSEYPPSPSSENESSPTTRHAPRPHHPPHHRTATTRLILIHATLILIYTVTAWLVVEWRSPHRCAAALPPSPIHGLQREYAPTLFYNLNHSAYAGRPSDDDAIDAAWDKLLEPMHLRVTREELEGDEQASVELVEGGGFLGWMGAYHELHCVRMLRKWSYRDYYHPHLTGEEEEHMFSHVDHCIDLLRQTAICHADASLTTFVWSPAKQRPMFNASESRHECIDWSKLVASVEDRVVSEDEIFRLQNPLLQANHTF